MAKTNTEEPRPAPGLSLFDRVAGRMFCHHCTKLGASIAADMAIRDASILVEKIAAHKRKEK